MNKTPLQEWQQLLEDYKKDNNFILKQAFHWLTPKENGMRNLPTKSQLMSTEDEPADGSQGDKHKNKPSSNKPLDPKSKKSEKSANSSSSKDMSPARQIMKAVTSHALNPKKKPVPKSVKSKGERQSPGARSNSGSQIAQGKKHESDGDEDDAV